MIKVCRDCKCSKPLSEYNKHPNGKYGVDTRCRECQRIYRAKYYAENKKALMEASKQWYEENKDKARLVRKTWRVLNREIHRAHTKAYDKRKPEIKAAQYAGRKVASNVAWANQKYIHLFYEIAKLETEETGVKHHVDHIVPINSKIVCGLHVEYNLQVLTASQNTAKGNRIWAEMP